MARRNNARNINFRFAETNAIRKDARMLPKWDVDFEVCLTSFSVGVFFVAVKYSEMCCPEASDKDIAANEDEPF